MSGLEILQIPVLGDNYIYLAHDPVSGETAVIDPALADPVLGALAAKGWTLSQILNTHHHGDHVGGNMALKAATGCTITGAGHDADRLPGIGVQVGEGDEVRIGDQVGKVLEVPGHTSGHIAYWFAGSDALFCGDTLFSLGCGRVFEGTMDEMWNSLSKLRALPGSARVYCAHEYTQANAEFALSIEPDNPELRARAEEVSKLRAAGKPTVPSTLAMETATNPFLRADLEPLQQAAGLGGEDAGVVFAEIRLRKDHF